MDALRLIQLCQEHDVMGVLTDERQVMFDLETLAIHPRASVVSVAVVTLGSLWKEYNDIVANDGHPSTSQETTVLYAEWGEHARVMAMNKKCVSSKETIDWWFGPKVSPQARVAFHSKADDWNDDILTVSSALSESTRIWVHHPHFDIPIWDHWCDVHALPTGIFHRAVQDTQTLFNLMPMVGRVASDVPHHALFDTLAMGLQVEYCLLYQALMRKLTLNL